MKKRVLSLAMALALTLALAVPALAADGSMKIGTADDLLRFADRVSRGEHPDAVLTADVDLSGMEWEPIDCDDYSFTAEFKGYSGTFDGNGHTISGLRRHRLDSRWFGLFRFLGDDGVIQDLELADVDIQLGCPGGYSTFGGALVAYSYGSIQGCTVSGEISGVDGTYIGGIVGQLGDGGQVVDCRSDVDISIRVSEEGAGQYGHYDIGGIVGVGGFDTVIDGCVNNGALTANGPLNSCGGKVAGISSYSGGIVRNCVNTGNITATGCPGVGNSGVVLGGVMGTAGDGLYNCANTGDIHMEMNGVDARANGIAGERTPAAQNCWSSGKVTGFNAKGDLTPSSFWSADTCSLYYLDGAPAAGAWGKLFSESELYGGGLTETLNGFVRDNPEKELRLWSQSSAGPVLREEAGGTETPVEPPAVAFTDVQPGAYYAEAVQWAVENGITTGTSATTFSPELTCNRAQIITFLYRAVGAPIIHPDASSPFTDVAKGTYYHNAAVWASIDDVVTGSSLAPDAPCTRAAAMEFLWRSLGQPIPGVGANPFTDVSDGDSFRDAVLWAVSAGVTTGTSTTTFSPDQTCTRGQIVTFLYRAFA